MHISSHILSTTLDLAEDSLVASRMESKENSCPKRLHRRTAYNLGRRFANELRHWFGLGVLVAGMLGISSAFILLGELWRAIKWADQVCLYPLSTALLTRVPRYNSC